MLRHMDRHDAIVTSATHKLDFWNEIPLEDLLNLAYSTHAFYLRSYVESAREIGLTQYGIQR